MAKQMFGWPPSDEPPPIAMREHPNGPVNTLRGLQYAFVPKGYVGDRHLQTVWMPEIDRWCTETIGPAAEAWGRIGTIYYIFTLTGATAFKIRWC